MSAAKKPQMTRQGIIKAVWAISRELGIDSDGLHDILFRETRQESMRIASDAELKKLLDALRLYQGEDQIHNDMLSKKQENYIYDLARRLGWSNDPKRLQGFVKKYYHVDRVEWLKKKDASNLIESLKKMLERAENGQEEVEATYG